MLRPWAQHPLPSFAFNLGPCCGLWWARTAAVDRAVPCDTPHGKERSAARLADRIFPTMPTFLTAGTVSRFPVRRLYGAPRERNSERPRCYRPAEAIEGTLGRSESSRRSTLGRTRQRCEVSLRATRAGFRGPRRRHQLNLTILSAAQVQEVVERMLKFRGRRIDVSTRSWTRCCPKQVSANNRVRACGEASYETWLE